MQSKASSHTSTGLNALHGYRFSIDDFTSSQADKILLSCLQVGGNETCKKKMKNEIYAQREEKSQFYSTVGSKRLDRFLEKFIVNLLQKLHVSQSRIEYIINSSKDKTEPKPFRKWQPTETFEAITQKQFCDREILAALQPGSSDLSGWERVKRAFLPNFYLPNYSTREPSHTYNRKLLVDTSLWGGMSVGFMMGFRPALNSMSDFERTAASNMFYSVRHARRQRYDSFLKGYFRYTFKWGWRVGFLIGSTFLISQSLALYRLQDKMSHYVIATAIPCALYKWHRGPKGMLVTSALGMLLLGIPLGFVFGKCGLNPRPVRYDAYIKPEISTSSHWYNWSSKQRELNEIRLNAILDEVSQSRTKVETEASQIYKDLFAPLHSLLSR